MREMDLTSITTDKLLLPLLFEKKMEADVLRLDQIHPLVSGNKWFKLRYYLTAAKQENKKTIVTFGGAWSNHILATAAACQLQGFKSIGIIRGEEAANLSPTLLRAKEAGMQLIFISREDYSIKKIPEQLNNADYYFINEGGYGIPGANGAATILDYCEKEKYTHICCAAGTGTMTAGLIKAALPQQLVISISVLKNNMALEQDVKSLLNGSENSFQLFHDYHFGGYAKHQPALLEFMNSFYLKVKIPSDFVYTGKLFFAISDLICNNFFTTGSKLLLIHSGGLQGNASLKKGTLIF